MILSPVLTLHIASGTAALLAGTAAIVVRKGSRIHARTGIVFAVAMLSLGASGIWLAYLKSQPGNLIGGTVTLYMVATAWRAGRVRQAMRAPADYAALFAALTIGTLCALYGFQVATGRMLPHDGVPAGMDFFFACITLIGACGDLHLLLRRGLTGTSRIARHLWRMCFALFIAAGSFFMGRQALFPAIIRRAQLPLIFTLLPLLLLVFWLVRVRLARTPAQLTPASD